MKWAQFFIYLACFLTFGQALSKGEPKEADVLPFGLGRQMVRKSFVEFGINPDSGKLYFLNYSEYQSAHQKPLRLVVSLYDASGKSLEESKSSCLTSTRISFPPLTFNKVRKYRLSRIDSFSMGYRQCDPQKKVSSKIDSPSTVEGLSDPSEMVRAKTTRALEISGKAYLGELADLLSSDDRNLRENAAFVLSRIQNPEAQQLFQRTVQNSSRPRLSSSSPSTQEGLSIQVKAIHETFAQNEPMTVKIVVKNDSPEPFTLYDLGNCASDWSFWFEDLQTGGFWKASNSSKDLAPAEAITLEPQTTKELTCELGLFYWKTTQDKDSRPSRYDAWSHYLPQGRYLFKGDRVFRIPENAAFVQAPYWTGWIRSRADALEVTDEKLPRHSERSPLDETSETAPLLDPEVQEAIDEIDSEQSLFQPPLAAIQTLQSRDTAESREALANYIDKAIRAFADEDEKVQESAVSAVTIIGEAAVDPLILSLQNINKNVRKNSAKSLGLIASQKAVDPLLQSLEDEEIEVREEAAFSLNKIGTPMAVGAFTDYVKRSLPEMMDNLKRDDPVIKLKTVTAIGRMGPLASDAVPALTTCLSDPSPEIVRAALEALKLINTPEAEEAIQNYHHLQAKLKEAEEAKLKAETKVKKEEVNPTDLSAFLRDSPLKNKPKITDDTEEEKKTSFIPLGNVLSDLRKSVKGSKKSKSILEDDLYQKFHKNLSDPDPRLRSQGADGLGNMGADAENAVPDLARLLNDSDFFVRLTAKVALENIGTPEALEAIGKKEDEN